MINLRSPGASPQFDQKLQRIGPKSERRQTGDGGTDGGWDEREGDGEKNRKGERNGEVGGRRPLRHPWVQLSVLVRARRR